MECVVYTGKRKPGTYLFVEVKDNFERVPDSLLEMMGELHLVIELELAEGRQLARADAAQVRAALSENGYYLQLPPEDFKNLL